MSGRLKIYNDSTSSWEYVADGIYGQTADYISEVTANNGVVVDGVRLKDNKLATDNSVVTSNVTDGNITLVKLDASTQTTLGYLSAPDAGWITPSFTNSWVNYGSGHNDCGYRKDALGYVHLKGLVKNGTDGASIFTLPAGYRPVAVELLVCASVDHYGRLDIATAGTVSPSSSNTEPGWVCLDGITFKAFQ